MPKKNLLIITPVYPSKNEEYYGGTFVKYQVEYLKQYFENIYIISPVYQSLKILEKDKLCKDYTDGNVHVFFPRCVYYPEFFFNKIVIDNRLSVVKKTIERNHLKFDLIHAHFTWPSGYIAGVLKDIYHVPVVTTIHEDRGWFCREAESKHPYFIKSWSSADVLIRVNKRDLPVLAEYNKNAVCIPNGFTPAASADKKTAREELNLSGKLSGNKKFIFALGPLIKRKGFNYLIDALSEISKTRSDFVCIIGGQGEERNNLISQIRQNGLEDKVSLAGRLPGDKLHLWYSASDFFVLPSLNEGNPTVMFEALGYGRPYIGTNVGGVAEIITSDDYGLLMDPEDTDTLIRQINRALDTEWDEKRILEYSKQFRWDNIAARLYEIYISLLKM